MKRSVFYCKSWFRAKKRPTVVWTEEQARSAHLSKQHYTALVDSADRPYCFLDVSDRVIGVGFLDENLRESLTYAFQEVDGGRLFLTMATHREFEGDTDKVISGVSYIFKQTGVVQIRREFFSPHRLETMEKSFDVSTNYSVIPSFGDYDDLVKIERN